MEVQDRETAIHFRDRILTEDEQGAIGRRVLGENALTVTTEPPGAELYLFRIYDLHDLDPTQESREVPAGVPIQSALVPLGAASWRWEADAALDSERSGLFLDPLGRSGGLLPDPRSWVRLMRERGIPSHAVGGVEAGPVTRMAVPSSARLRPTLIPLPCEPGNLVAKSPAIDIPVLPGNYVAIARLAGYADRRLLFRVPHRGLQPESTGVGRHARLIADSETRPGMVWISCDEPRCAERPFWIMETEVTRIQYEEFLAARGRREDLRPRLGSVAGRMEKDLPSDAPILGVSATAAEQYAEWKNELEGVRAQGWEYALPALSQWIRAHGNVPHYAFGEVFHARQVKSRFAAEAPEITPVMSHPLDESRWGVYDLAGSAQEWLREFRDGPDGRDQALGGGSWLESDPAAFRASHLDWLKPEQSTAATGFRLVLQPREGQ